MYQKQGVFDRNFKVSDLDLNIKACTFGSISSHTNSTFSVFRHEFLELQIRVSMDKYLRTGVLKSEPEALKGFFDKNWCLDINPCEWRVKRLYNEECDMVLTGFKESLLVLYENTKQKRFKNIEKKGVVEEDFIIMMQEHGFFNEKFTNRYGSICFHLALISRVDEVNSSTHMQANFVEFLEAFCRVVDLSDSKDPEKNIFKGYTDENYSLDHKLESALLNFAYLKPRKNRRN